MKKKKNDDFLMLPTVDYCFKELLAYPEVRKGFVAAILGKNPEEIEETILMPTILSKDTENGKYGILEPVDTCEKISPKEIDLALIPCLSCSRDGRRLGYGGGYYDRFLPLCTRAVKLAAAFELQRAAAVPIDSFDVAMDAVATELRIY